MSTNKTKNLGLHSWVETDPVLMREFNENFGAIDAATKNLENGINSISASLTSKVDSVQALMMKPICGTYTGDGAITKTLFFSGTPKLIIVRQNTYGGIFRTMIMISGDSRVLNYTTYNSCSFSNVTWSDNSTSWMATSNNNTDILNTTGEVYYYIAFCV